MIEEKTNKVIIQKEFILCAAIDYDGTIVCGHRHGDCYDVLKSLVVEIESDKIPTRKNQGFLTSENRYVGREEAWVIAKENNQIVHGLKLSDRYNNALDELDKHLGIKKPASILISEHLY